MIEEDQGFVKNVTTTEQNISLTSTQQPLHDSRTSRLLHTIAILVIILSEVQLPTLTSYYLLIARRRYALPLVIRARLARNHRIELLLHLRLSLLLLHGIESASSSMLCSRYMPPARRRGRT